MKTETPFKRAVAALAGTVLAFTGSTFTADAADTTSTEAETSTSATETTSAETTTEAEKAEEGEQEIEWYKAKLDDYDDSLSLIS